MLRWPARFVDNNLKKKKKRKERKKEKNPYSKFFFTERTTYKNGDCLIAIITEKLYYPPRKENYGFVIRE